MVIANVNAASACHLRVLLAIQEIPIMRPQGSTWARSFWDNGATICLCTHDWAARNGLVGEDAEIFLKVVHRVNEKLESKKYLFDIVDRQGTAWSI